jgi:hypothetical protein
MSHGKHKAEKLATARRLYLLATDGLTDIALAKALHIDRATAYRYRKELQATEVSEGRYTLEPSNEDIDLALAVLQRASHRDPH